MCRFAFYQGPPLLVSQLVSEPDHPILHQSYCARERLEPLNGDGYGIAWYDHAISDQPALLREVQPAWSSLNLASVTALAESPCILAHVRAASDGMTVTQLNCHPFTAGSLAFMHNGEVAAFAQLRRSLLAGLSDSAFASLKGSTDSELMFALIRDRLDTPTPSLAQMAKAMASVIEQVEHLAAQHDCRQAAMLNLVLSDGRCAVVSRYATDGGAAAQSLYLHQGARYTCTEGVCQMNRDAQGGCVIVASEPLSSDAGWRAVEPNTILLIDADLQVASHPLAISRRLST